VYKQGIVKEFYVV